MSWELQFTCYRWTANLTLRFLAASSGEHDRLNDSRSPYVKTNELLQSITILGTKIDLRDPPWQVTQYTQCCLAHSSPLRVAAFVILTETYLGSWGCLRAFWVTQEATSKEDSHSVCLKLGNLWDVISAHRRRQTFPAEGPMFCLVWRSGF